MFPIVRATVVVACVAMLATASVGLAASNLSSSRSNLYRVTVTVEGEAGEVTLDACESADPRSACAAAATTFGAGAKKAEEKAKEMKLCAQPESEGCVIGASGPGARADLLSLGCTTYEDPQRGTVEDCHVGALP